MTDVLKRFELMPVCPGCLQSRNAARDRDRAEIDSQRLRAVLSKIKALDDRSELSEAGKWLRAYALAADELDPIPSKSNL